MDYNKSNGMFTDMEYVEALGLDPSLAGTPDINKAIVKAVRESTVRDLMQEGLTEQQAMKSASKLIK